MLFSEALTPFTVKGNETVRGAFSGVELHTGKSTALQLPAPGVNHLFSHDHTVRLGVIGGGRSLVWALHSAIGFGDHECVRTALLQGADPNEAIVGGLTPLHKAAYRGQLEACQYLVERNANVVKGDSQGRTPLHVAATQGQTGVVQLLLRQKAQVDAEDLEGQTVIRACIATLYDKKVDITKIALCLEHLVRHLDDEIHRKQRLLATTEKPSNALPNEEEAPRAFFSQDNQPVDDNEKRVSSLLAMKAAAAPQPLSPKLLQSVRSGDRGGADCVEDGDAVFSSRRFIKLRTGVLKQSTEMHALHEAPQEQAYSRALQINPWDRPTLQPIHIGGPDVGPIGSARTMSSVLQSAIGTRDLALVRRALTAGVCASDGDCGGLAPLHKAAFHGDLELCKLLLDHGACPTTLDGEGQSALHMASLAVQPGVVKVLLQRKACVSMPNSEGAAPLQALVAKLHSKEGICTPDGKVFDRKRLALVLETLARAQQNEYHRVTMALHVHENDAEKERASQEELLGKPKAELNLPAPKVEAPPPVAAPEETTKSESLRDPAKKEQEKQSPDKSASETLRPATMAVPPPASAESPVPDFENMDVVSLCTYCEDKNILIPDDCNTKRKLAIFVKESVRTQQ